MVIRNPFDSHEPDHTYNQVSVSRPNDPGCAYPGARLFYMTNEWNYNELRTLQMEQEVFEQLQEDFADEIASNGESKLSWSDIAGDGDSRIGDTRYVDITDDNGYRYQSATTSGLTSVLQDFNAFNPETHPDGSEVGKAAKVAILNEWLLQKSGIVGKDGKPIKIPEYNKGVKAQAAKDRVRILGGIDLGERLSSEPRVDER